MTDDKGIVGSVKDAVTNFDRPASWYIEVGGYLIAGFIFGFLVKYGGKLFFLLLLGAALALWALDYLQLITIHYGALKSAAGMSPEMGLQEVINTGINWVRSHIIESIAAFFGFILAWKFA